MHTIRLTVSTAFALLATSASVGFAIEPAAPDRLFTAEESAAITIRREASTHRVPKKPTQAQKGASIDWTALRDYYGSGAAKLVWVDKDGLNERAKEAAKEIAKAAEWGLDPAAFDLPSDDLDVPEGGLSSAQQVRLEMKVSLAVAKYARYARGGRMDPADLSLDIDVNPPLMSGREILGGAAEADDVAAFLRGLHPQHDQFKKLRVAYLEALLEEADQALLGTTEPEPAAQSKKNKKRKARKRRSKTKLSQRLLYNMEMWRWMPAELGDTYVQPNVPEYRIRVVKDGKILHSERMVVGKVEKKDACLFG